MSQSVSPLAGKPAPASILVDVKALLSAYRDRRPDPKVAAQRVSFGTSGHRGSSFDTSDLRLSPIEKDRRPALSRDRHPRVVATCV
mgnify:CR=1 FL=1